MTAEQVDCSSIQSVRNHSVLDDSRKESAHDERIRQSALNLDGYTDLPPGKIATIVTYLEMREPPACLPIRQPEDWTLQRIDQDRRRATGPCSARSASPGSGSAGR